MVRCATEPLEVAPHNVRLAGLARDVNMSFPSDLRETTYLFHFQNLFGFLNFLVNFPHSTSTQLGLKRRHCWILQLRCSSHILEVAENIGPSVCTRGDMARASRVHLT
ncbi:hypothetical protein PoB_007345500 [Plakobranchus ocellatus]|uniref:Uncharacterized protein n=1 Tax=Plakobranchus ocellatus TaxID=259542 RepID=A0AAV4DSE8_9GAST|nr:hypothetical protein PoB_007345500 [Plakobranchus ocellatus]